MRWWETGERERVAGIFSFCRSDRQGRQPKNTKPTDGDENKANEATKLVRPRSSSSQDLVSLISVSAFESRSREADT